jgi:pimeloyl-ACP methyl ester carboxylesterase
MLYNSNPIQFVALDQGLVALQAGNYELLSLISQDAQISSLNPDYDERMALTLIVCADSHGRTNFTNFDDYKTYVEFMNDKSEYGGLFAASASGPICSEFNVQPPASQTFDGIPRIDNTSAPILFISGIADPITPLISAMKYHDIFEGSGLLMFNDSGHTAHLRKATCVAKYEKEYLLHGTLPPANTTCEVDEPNPFITMAELLDAEPAEEL